MVIPSPSSGVPSWSYKLKLACFVVIACLPAFAAIERGVMLREGVITTSTPAPIRPSSPTSAAAAKSP